MRRSPFLKPHPHGKDDDRAIKTTDQQIDRLVYGLYGLTEEEIQIVEGKEGHHV